MAPEAKVARHGIYNVEYFSGAQVSLYIGDIWVDEVTTLDYSIMQNRTPIYGYASTLWDDVTEGHVLVQGTFTVNFKEAGYLWLILKRYQGFHGGSGSIEEDPFVDSANVYRATVEKLINNETNIYDRNLALSQLAEELQLVNNLSGEQLAEAINNRVESTRRDAARTLGGYASATRSLGGVGTAEGLYEGFEDAVWGKTGKQLDEQEGRRTDDPSLNPFDMYVAFGDFAGDNRANHTIERIREVTLLGKSKKIIIDGMPLQEAYHFIARNLV